MGKLTVALWSLLWLFVVGGIAGVVVLVIHEGDTVVVALTLAFTIVAAVGASMGSFITWRGNKQARNQQQQMGEDVRRLAELTESSIEEARSHRPDPVVQFVVGGDEASSAAVLMPIRIDREVDVEQIVESERRRALATLPRERSRRPASEPGVAGALGTSLAGIDKIVEQMAGLEQLVGLGLGPLRGPATEEERAVFKEEIDEYIADLRSWLSEFEAWRAGRNELVSFVLRFDNGGRVPAYDARVEVHFPDPFEEGPEEYLTLDRAPKRPRFTRGGLKIPGLAASVYPGFDVGSLHRPGDLLPSTRNVSRPRFRKGSVLVDIDIKKLLHGVSEDSDVITLRVPADGTYTIPWEIRAENLAEPVRGELQFEIQTRIEPGAPIATLDEILRIVEGDEDPASSVDE